MQRFLFSSGLILIALQALPVGASCSPRLFAIERSKNANIVVYDAQLQGGSYDAQKPVSAYWLMKAEKGQRQEMNFIEKMKAYGFKVETEPSGMRMTMKALKDRPTRLVVAKGCPCAIMRIGGRDAFVGRIFIKTREGSDSNVEFIELSGRAVSNGRALRERFSPK
jgi:hypothetical protein